MLNYLKGIVYITLISAIVSQLLPGEDYRKYGRILTGFLIILLFLQPFLQWSEIYPKLEQNYEYFLEEGSKKVDMDSDSYMEQHKELLVKEAVANAISQKGYHAKKVEVNIRGETIRSIRVRLEGVVEKEEKEQMQAYLGEQYELEKSQIELE